MSAELQFSQWSQMVQQRTEQALQQHLPAEHLNPTRLHQAMRYACLGGGKRLRAMLAYAAGEYCGSPVQRVDVVAVALECMHAYSLIHDDLPCMDDDDLRRGKPSCHRQFDEATALLAGDALQTLAFSVLSRADLHSDAQQQLKMLALLAQASGSLGMAGGQAIDLAHVGKAMDLAQLEQMHQLKTGALIHAATLLGAYAADQAAAHKLSALQQYAQAIGLAFQVMDDVLDAQADTQTLGKTAGKDALHNKPTYVALLGLAKAQQLAEQLVQQAVQALSDAKQANSKQADVAATRLIQIAQFIAQRAY